MWFFHVATALCSLKNLCSSFLFCTSSVVWAFWSYISEREKKSPISQQKLLMESLHDRHDMHPGEYITLIFPLGRFGSLWVIRSLLAGHRVVIPPPGGSGLGMLSDACIRECACRTDVDTCIHTWSGGRWAHLISDRRLWLTGPDPKQICAHLWEHRCLSGFGLLKFTTDKRSSDSGGDKQPRPMLLSSRKEREREREQKKISWKNTEHKIRLITYIPPCCTLFMQGGCV